MSIRKSLKHFSVAFGLAVFSSVLAVTISSAQTTLVNRVEAPVSGATVNGAVTFTGVAVDCGSGAPATRVAVYDGTSSSGPYLADVSMEIVRSYADACTNRPGSAQYGYKLILDSNRIANGQHTLAFVATYPGGTSLTANTNIVVQNGAAAYNNYTYATSNPSDLSHYWVHYDYPTNQCYYSYCNPYQGIYGSAYYGAGYAGYPYYGAGYYGAGTVPAYTCGGLFTPYPIYTLGAYRSYPSSYYNTLYNSASYYPYTGSTYAAPYNYYPYNGSAYNYPYYWNGYTWVLR